MRVRLARPPNCSVQVVVGNDGLQYPIVNDAVEMDDANIPPSLYGLGFAVAEVTQGDVHPAAAPSSSDDSRNPRRGETE